MSDNSFILPPDPARIMESLRDTGYDFNTAIADLVDNSIAANASVIKIYIDVLPKTHDINIYIADNGCGMDLEGLKNAMKYGSSHREDPSSLGKYGLGLKTASTAFCRSLSLLSKTDSSEYNKVRWDLDEICKTNEWQLLHLDVDDDEVDILDQITNGKSGTLVIWNKVDRLIKNTTEKGVQNALVRITSGLKQHLAMVFERFLDKNFKDANNIDIYLNDELIEPWDPFCKNEPITEKVAEENVQIDLPNNEKSSFIVQAYVIPSRDNFSNLDNYSKALVSNDYEGFYIYRENRLIHYGDWLKMNKNDPHYSYLRINFSFDHTLDAAFNVDIKKSRIALNDEIYDYLKENFLPAPRRAAEESYRKGKRKNIEKTAEGAHSPSNNNIENKAKTIEGATVDVIDEQKVQVTNPQGTFISDKIRVQPSTEKNLTRVIPVESIDSNMLWEPTIADGHHAVSVNQSHPYYEKVYAPILDNTNIVTGMDALLWSLAEAELMTYNDETKEQYEEMRVQVSRILKKLVADLPEPDLDKDNN